MMERVKEWSGSQHPERPGDAWLDDETGESVCAWCAERGATLASIRHAAQCGYQNQRREQ